MIILELYNPDKEYDSDCIIAPLSSTYRGTKLIKKGTTFSNVDGSLNDKNPYSAPWIGIMRLVYDVLRVNSQDLNNCCATPYYYNWEDEEFDRMHSGDVVGGHVYIAEGDDVFLLPICISHNNLNSEMGYMMLERDILAIELADCILN